MKLFEYCVLYHPTPEEKKKGEKDKLVVPVNQVIANDQGAATLLAGRAIPEEYLGRLDQLEVAVRPF